MPLTLTSEARVLNPKACRIQGRWDLGGTKPTRKTGGLEGLSPPNIKKIGPVTINDMQTPPPPLRSGHHYIKYEQCAETNENLCIRFFRVLVFELLLPKKIQKTSKNEIVHKWANLQERCGLI